MPRKKEAEKLPWELDQYAVLQQAVVACNHTPTGYGGVCRDCSKTAVTKVLGMCQHTSACHKARKHDSKTNSLCYKKARNHLHDKHMRKEKRYKKAAIQKAVAALITAQVFEQQQQSESSAATEKKTAPTRQTTPAQTTPALELHTHAMSAEEEGKEDEVPAMDEPLAPLVVIFLRTSEAPALPAAIQPTCYEEIVDVTKPKSVQWGLNRALQRVNKANLNDDRRIAIVIGAHGMPLVVTFQNRFIYCHELAQSIKDTFDKYAADRFTLVGLLFDSCLGAFHISDVPKMWSA